jgi:hypothetical protein
MALVTTLMAPHSRTTVGEGVVVDMAGATAATVEEAMVVVEAMAVGVAEGAGTSTA